jgi:hypothetical protein
VIPRPTLAEIAEDAEIAEKGVLLSVTSKPLSFRERVRVRGRARTVSETKHPLPASPSERGRRNGSGSISSVI